MLEKYYKENGAPRAKWTYPNPTDLFEAIKHKPKESIFLGLERLISPIKPTPDKNETYFFKYQFFSLETSLSSGTIWNYVGDRISLNLRDLYYSLKRIDKAKDDYLENRIAIPTGIATAAGTGAWIGNELADKAVDLGEGVSAVPLDLNDAEAREFEREFARILQEDLDKGGL